MSWVLSREGGGPAVLEVTSQTFLLAAATASAVSRPMAGGFDGTAKPKVAGEFSKERKKSFRAESGRCRMSPQGKGERGKAAPRG